MHWHRPSQSYVVKLASMLCLTEAQSVEQAMPSMIIHTVLPESMPLSVPLAVVPSVSGILL